jgi:small subunit ribosomal protein S20
VANSAQAKKRIKQAGKHRQTNMALRSTARTAIKKVVRAVETGNRAAAQEAYKSALPIIDSSVNKGILHKNKAARHKKRMVAAILRLPA